MKLHLQYHVILSFLFWGGFSHLFGQNEKFEYNFINYNIQEGLPSSEVYSVIQDKEGYIWFSTDKGVSRFDGYEFMNLSVENGLPDNTIFGIHEDNKGKLWFRSFSGKLSYYYKGSIYVPPVSEKLSEVLNNRILISLGFGKDSVIYIGVLGKGLGSITENRLLNTYVEKKQGEATYAYWLKEDVNGEVVFAHNVSGAIEEARKNSEIIIASKEGYQKYKINLDFRGGKLKAIKFSDKYYIISVDNQLLWIKDSTSIDIIGNLNEDIISISEVNGNLWVGTNIGNIFIYTLKNNEFIQTDKIAIKSPVSAVLNDNRGGVWITTLENGVYYIPSLHFKSYVLNPTLEKRNQNPTSILSFYNEVFVGYTGGIVERHIGKNLVRNEIPFHSDRVQYVYKFFSLRDSVYAQTSGKIYAFCRNNIKNVSSPIKIRTNTHGNDNAICLAKKYSNSFWTGNHLGIKRYENNKVVYISREDGFEKRVFSLCEDNTGNLLIGTLSGLWKYDGTSYSDISEKHSFLKARVTEIKIKENVLVFASRGNGILIKKEGKYFSITKKDGLLSNNISSFTIRGNDLWITTDKGINHVINFLNYSPKIYSYTEKDGLLSNDVRDLTFHKDTIWAATLMGVVKFKPYKQETSYLSFPLIMNGVYINDLEVDVKNEYFLSYKENYLSVDFTGLSYKDRGDLLYEYKLVGVEDNWIKTTSKHLRFSALNPGNYVLKIRAIDYENKKSDVFEAKINILSPFWKRWYFYILASLTTLLIAILLFYWRIKIVKEKYLTQNRMYELEKKALQTQMNPHFIFNSLNSIQNFISENDATKSEHYLALFAKLMRLILNSSREEGVSLSDEIKTLEYYLQLESLRFKNTFEYRIEIETNMETEFIEIAPMLIQPYVENAILHGMANKGVKGHILIKFYIQEEKLICIVEDDGIGREKAKKIVAKENGSQKSYGVLITNERLRLLGLAQNTNFVVETIDLKDDKGKPTGTKILMYIPFKQ